MTPQEQQLVNDLFARLAQLESAPRDPDAERLIAQGVQKAPNAAYALVQTALVQDEALKRANARIEQLQAQLGSAAQPQRQQGGFLDNMRDALFGRDEPHGSVPTVRPQAAQPAETSGDEPGYAPQRPAPAMTAQPSFGAEPPFGAGGSFLGTAASAAAGAIGGGLLLNGIRSMFGHHAGFGGAFGGHHQDSELAHGHGSDNDLAREAGIDDIDKNDDDHDQHDRQDQDDLDAADGSDDDAFDTADADDDGSFDDDDGGAGSDDSYDV
jgi:uncharacterized protein